MKARISAGVKLCKGFLAHRPPRCSPESQEPRDIIAIGAQRIGAGAPFMALANVSQILAKSGSAPAAIQSVLMVTPAFLASAMKAASPCRSEDD